MFSNIFLNKENLIYNARKVKEISGHKLCAMIKANAYGHGSKEMVKILNNEVDFFGVSNQAEALEIKPLTDKSVVVMGAADDYQVCIEQGLSFIVFSLNHIKEIVSISESLGKAAKMHLCINSGMNRYGVNNKREFKEIIDFLIEKNIELEGIYTHFSSLTTDSDYTLRQRDIFYEYCSLIPKEWKTIRHIGGGGTIFTDFKADMNRVGLFLFGYGRDIFKPVLTIKSKIVDVVKVNKQEHIGYLCGFTADHDMKIATIPLGYGDGLPRKLSNKLQVEINGKKVKNVGNICMDAFMVDVSEIDCKIGDTVEIMNCASEIAKLLDTTEYEVLTNLTKFRGKRIII